MTTEIPATLSGFFEAFSSMVELRLSPREVVDRIGPCPSGTKRLGFYRILAHRSRFLTLRDVCPVLRHAALSLEPPVWQKLVERYSTLHPPQVRDPNRHAEGLSDFIAEERASGWDLPEYLEEIADFEISEYLVGVSSFEPSTDDPGLDRTLLVRHYTHDVPRFVLDHRKGIVAAAPEPTPRAALLYRDVRSQYARVFFPTRLGLLALAARAGKAVSLSGVDLQALAAAERELEGYGVLIARA